MTSTKDARRFAIFTTEEMLRKGGITIHQLPFIQRAFYELALQDNIAMSPIPDEARFKTLKWGANPLKMHLDPESYRGKCITANNRQAYEQAKRVMFGNGK